MSTPSQDAIDALRYALSLRAAAPKIFTEFYSTWGAQNSWIRDLFRRPGVYDWHDPKEHPDGRFVSRPDPYEWFDPFEGRQRALPPERDDVLTITDISRRVVWIGADFG